VHDSLALNLSVVYRREPETMKQPACSLRPRAKWSAAQTPYQCINVVIETQANVARRGKGKVLASEKSALHRNV
jgi:hypothetical protein